MSKVTLSGYILVSESELTKARKLLAEHIELTQAEVGCLVFNVEEHPSQFGRFDVYEEFISAEAFHFHQHRVQESEWGRGTENVQRFYTIEELER